MFRWASCFLSSFSMSLRLSASSIILSSLIISSSLTTPSPSISRWAYLESTSSFFLAIHLISLLYKYLLLIIHHLFASFQIFIFNMLNKKRNVYLPLPRATYFQFLSRNNCDVALTQNSVYSNFLDYCERGFY